MSSREIINVAGYGFSGSSALVDFLRGTDSIECFGTEFRLIQDPDGIIDLENSLVNGWNHVKPHVAISRFRNLTQRLGKKDRWFIPTNGMNYNQYCGGKFYYHTGRYIESITEFTYDGGNIYNRLKKPIWEKYVRLLYYKLANKYPSDQLYFSIPEQKFARKTRDYIQNIVGSSIENEDTEYFVLDQSIHPRQVEQSLRYFNPAELILVDRDPRDSYLDSLNAPFVPTQTVDNFIQFYRTMRRDSARLDNDPRVLSIDFEDLVLNYDRATSQVFDFLSIEEYEVTENYFDPVESAENIGMYKDSPTHADAIETIRNSLEEYCYDLDNYDGPLSS